MKYFEFGKTFVYVLVSIIAFEFISLLGWFYPDINHIIFGILTAGIFILAWKRLDLAVFVLVIELVIGSKGYLFSWNIGDLTISIRLALFISVLAVWVLKYFLRGKIAIRKSNLYWWYIGFLIIFVWGVLNGFLRGNDNKNIFFDANGWLYFGLFFVFFEAIRNRENIKKLLEVLLASVTALGIKTLTLLFLFAGQYTFLPEIYRWVRDTRVNEVTLITNNFYRIFSQSHIYSMLAFIILLTVLSLLAKKSLDNRFLKISLVFIIASLSVLISYSRTFWLSLAVVFIGMLYFFIYKYKFTVQKTFRYLAILFIVLVAQVMFIFVFINTPNWIKFGGETTSLSSLVDERLGDTQEAALQSRWNLLEPLARKMLHHPVVGAGFGTEVTYLSEDPRIVESSGGIYSTFVFEWGYFDIILKVGLLGLMIYLLFIWKIAQKGFRAYRMLESEEKIICLGLLFGLLALVVTHLTTPYLNHPLGIGYIMITAVIFERLNNESREASQSNN